MTASTTEETVEVAGVQVRWLKVTVSGHTVQQALLYDVAEAEAVHGRPFDDELDHEAQTAMFAMDRIWMDETMHRVASRHERHHRRDMYPDSENRALQRDRAGQRQLGHHPRRRQACGN